MLDAAWFSEDALRAWAQEVLTDGERIDGLQKVLSPNLEFAIRNPAGRGRVGGTVCYDSAADCEINKYNILSEFGVDVDETAPHKLYLARRKGSTWRGTLRVNYMCMHRPLEEEDPFARFPVYKTLYRHNNRVYYTYGSKERPEVDNEFPKDHCEVVKGDLEVKFWKEEEMIDFCRRANILADFEGRSLFLDKRWLRAYFVSVIVPQSLDYSTVNFGDICQLKIETEPIVDLASAREAIETLEGGLRTIVDSANSSPTRGNPQNPGDFILSREMFDWPIAREFPEWGKLIARIEVDQEQPYGGKTFFHVWSKVERGRNVIYIKGIESYIDDKNFTSQEAISW